MAFLHSMLLPLGLFLYLGLQFSSASPANYSDNCTVFDKVFTTTSPGIMANSVIYERNTAYTVWVPVDDSISSVVLRAVDNNNNSVGFWQEADEQCYSSSLYHVTHAINMLFKADWMSPDSGNITEVELQAFAVSPHKTATFSSLKLKKRVTTTRLASEFPTTSTSKIPTTSTSKVPMTFTSKIPTTLTSKIAMTLTSKIPTTLTTRSSANTAFGSSTTDAIHILLAFLTSKLLF
ncbi:placenta-expressed transcript 1 protein [Cynocephalus volans]|uniref:placenta-expressed transcript 1 protein n=1 Tax=Cynocephalus volans TaxID=110931 RepID=UPI002FCA53E6